MASIYDLWLKMWAEILLLWFNQNNINSLLYKQELTVPCVWYWYQMSIFYFFFIFSFWLILFLKDGRGLRHKYFKDYKDYLGKWGNVDNLKKITITEWEISSNLPDTALSLTGTSTNNAVSYEKHHHKHLGWSRFSATLNHVKPKTCAPLSHFRQSLMFSDVSALRSTRTPPQLRPRHNSRHQSSPDRSALITPEPGSDLPFSPKLQLLTPLCKAPYCSLSSVTKSFSETSLTYILHSQPKK